MVIQWKKGIEATQKSFAIAWNNKLVLLYIVISTITLSGILYKIFSFVVSDKIGLGLLFVSSIYNLLFLATIPVIFFTSSRFNLKKKKLTLPIIISLILWIIMEIGFVFLLNYFLPSTTATLLLLTGLPHSN